MVQEGAGLYCILVRSLVETIATTRSPFLLWLLASVGDLQQDYQDNCVCVCVCVKEGGGGGGGGGGFGC